LACAVYESHFFQSHPAICRLENPGIETTLDRRKKKTRRTLRESLFALILEKGDDVVTVDEIIRRADVGRTKFCLRYRDKEDLPLKCLEEIVDELAEQVNRAAAANLHRKNLPLEEWPVENNPTYLIFQHAAQNASIY